MAVLHGRDNGRHGRLYGSVEVAKRLRISSRQLYYWVGVLGAVRPNVRQHGGRTFLHFTARNVEDLKAVKDLVEWGYTLRAAVKLVKERTKSGRRGRFMTEIDA